MHGLNLQTDMLSDGGAFQGLSPDHRQAIKAWVAVTSSQSVSLVRSNEFFWRDF